MKSARMGWMVAISGTVALTLVTAACGTLDGPWAGVPAGAAPQSASPRTAPPTQASCEGGTAGSARAACGTQWFMPR